MRNSFGLPETNTQDWEDMVDFMRKDLESGMKYSQLIETTKKMMKKDGRDFDEEFKKWKEKQK